MHGFTHDHKGHELDKASVIASYSHSSFTLAVLISITAMSNQNIQFCAIIFISYFILICGKNVMHKSTAKIDHIIILIVIQLI